jgi:hypothetical protein
MLDYQWVQFRFLIIVGNRPRKKSMFTFLFWFFAIFHYVRCRIFNNWLKWGRSRTMLFLGGHVNIRRFFVPCNESPSFLDNFNFFDTCGLRKISQKKGPTLFYMYFGPPMKIPCFYMIQSEVDVSIFPMLITWGPCKIKKAW